eukprot:COSAG01_NODE_906_length_12834_cov_53.626620_2_plen_87_part_00
MSSQLSPSIWRRHANCMRALGSKPLPACPPMPTSCVSHCMAVRAHTTASTRDQHAMDLHPAMPARQQARTASRAAARVRGISPTDH